MEQNVVLGNRMKELMKAKNVGYQDLAEKSSVSIRRIYRMANGGVSNPGVFEMMRICNTLGVSLDEFFGTEELKAVVK